MDGVVQELWQVNPTVWSENQKFGRAAPNPIHQQALSEIWAKLPEKHVSRSKGRILLRIDLFPLEAGDESPCPGLNMLQRHEGTRRCSASLHGVCYDPLHG